MPPSKAQRRQRPTSEEHAAFGHLPAASVAEFDDPRPLSLRVPLTVLPRQISREALLAMITRKLLFHPVDPSTIVSAATGKQHVAGGASPPTSKALFAIGSDDDDEEEVRQHHHHHHHAAAAAASETGHGFPIRIVCGIHNEIQDVKVVGTVGSGEQQRTTVSVTVLADTINVLSDGMCSAKIITTMETGGGPNEREYDATAGDAAPRGKDDFVGLKLSIRCKNAEHYSELSKPKPKQQQQQQQQKKQKKSEKNKKKREHQKGDSESDALDDLNSNKSNSSSDSSSDDDEEKTLFFQAVVPADVPKLAAAAHSSDEARQALSGKFVLLSVEDHGRAWRAHAGLTPSLGAKDRKSWFVVLPNSYTKDQQQQEEAGAGGGGADGDAAQQKTKRNNSWKGQGVDLRNPRATKSSTQSRVVVAYKSEVPGARPAAPAAN